MDLLCGREAVSCRDVLLENTEREITTGSEIMEYHLKKINGHEPFLFFFINSTVLFALWILRHPHLKKNTVTFYFYLFFA